MDILSPVLSFSPVLSAAYTLIANLMEIKAIKEHNTQVVSEIDVFIKSINGNIRMLEEKLPSENGTWAIASLEGDLKEAKDYLKDCLNKGNFKIFWDARKIAEELERLRKDLSHKFQVKLFITTFEVIIDADKRTEDFHSRMLQLFALSAAHSSAATTEIRKLLQPLVVGIQRQDEAFQAFINGIRQTPREGNYERESETEKFIADVMANVDLLAKQQEDDQQYTDMFTGGLMIDPVKCDDGKTYCRFSIFRNNLEVSQSKRLAILCDDVSVRGRMFERFHDQRPDVTYKERRDAYKEEALRLAEGGHCAEAFDMLTNVLQWDKSDSKCIQMRRKMEETIATNSHSHRPGDDNQETIATSSHSHRSGDDNRETNATISHSHRPGDDNQETIATSSHSRPGDDNQVVKRMDETVATNIHSHHPADNNQVVKKMEHVMATNVQLHPPGDDNHIVKMNGNISDFDRRPPSPGETPTRMPEQTSNFPSHDQSWESISKPDSPLDLCIWSFCCCPCFVFLSVATYVGCLKWERK